ncbi:hypothetical protein LshimejAT787_0804370 [Lyophyllum shimeji]|uniref:Uncharacterized protein n=1 Tax=Lyophyllum shimeji TaxID=47721 RepID=A0A9P3PRU6_LYOSH|nr:hypothetical protein LshimejAT787_0804370 [Lyophyllum shimeji]
MSVHVYDQDRDLVSSREVEGKHSSWQYTYLLKESFTRFRSRKAYHLIAFYDPVTALRGETNLALPPLPTQGPPCLPSP